jgi:CHAT domain-containing protein
VVLAGANQPVSAQVDDGILTALEVAELDLAGVEVVTLSACETGLGQTAGGEGLLGLQRAFQVSGARTVVASLWKVPDHATVLLMQRFYDNLWRKKMTRLQALREAQLWMLHEASKQPELVRGLAEEARRSRQEDSRGIDFAEEQIPEEGKPLPPYYWAAFVLAGDWR